MSLANGSVPHLKAPVIVELGDVPNVDEIDATRLPEEFWDASGIHARLRREAYARYRSPEGLVGAVLARVAAHIDWRIMPPNAIGAHGTLNMLVALLGDPASGKGVTMNLAEKLLPKPTQPAADYRVRQVTAGTAEGLESAFLTKLKPPEGGPAEWQLTHRGVLMRIDEGSTLTKLGARSGSSLMETFRQAAMGEQLGKTNVQGGDYARPPIPALGYRFVGLLGVQPVHAVDIIGDAAAGTPQRFAWFNTRPRPDTPRNVEASGKPLDWTPPQWDAPRCKAVDLPPYGPRQVIGIDPAIAADIQEHHYQVAVGTIVVDELDAHRMYLRLKVASLLACLDRGRLVHELKVERHDWDLAEMIMVASDATRQIAIDAIRADSAARDQHEVERGARHAAASETAVVSARSKITRVAAVMANAVAASPGMTARAVLNRAASRDYQYRNAAFDLALAEGRIVARDDGLFYPPDAAV